MIDDGWLVSGGVCVSAPACARCAARHPMPTTPLIMSYDCRTVSSAVPPFWGLPCDAAAAAAAAVAGS